MAVCFACHAGRMAGSGSPSVRGTERETMRTGQKRGQVKRKNRGKRGTPGRARRFAGRCQLCAYASGLSKVRQLLDAYIGIPRLLMCTNYANEPGGWSEVLPTATCRNFKARRRPGRRARATCATHGAPVYTPGSGGRRIEVGQGLFATVDAADYRRLSKHKWYAYRHGRKIYAVCRTGGKTVYMHRMIMRPRRGELVDHADGNGLHNRRGNLRNCNAAQNRANARPSGRASVYVGVYPKGNKWRASITCRGVFYYLGLYDDPVAAAKARDRKAYELHGPFAYLNFPEDFRGGSVKSE